ncbi:hypothetical protein ABPG75_012757 [Micractinium tetrahymenae]
MAQAGNGVLTGAGSLQEGPPFRAPLQTSQPSHAALERALGDDACEPVRVADLACPVCFETLTDPFVTACGHSFCYACISRHLEAAKNCPSCSHYLTPDLIYPNFLLSKVVRRVRSSASLGRGAPPLQVLQQAIADHGAALAEPEVDSLLHQLWELKQGLQEKQREASMELLLHFLQNSREEKIRRLAQLQKELWCLDGDIQRVEAAGALTNGQAAPAGSHHVRPATPVRRPGPTAADMAAAATVPVMSAAAAAAQRQEEEGGRRQEEQQPPLGAAQGGADMAHQQLQGQPAEQQPTAGAQRFATAAGGAAGQEQAGAAGALLPPSAAAAAAAAAHAVGASALHHHALFQAQQAQQQAQQQTQQQHLADFASAAFASLATQAFAPGVPAAGSSLGAHQHTAVAPMHPAAAAAAGIAAGGAPHGPAAGVHPHSTALFGPSLLSPGTTTTTTTSSNGRPRDVLSLLRNKKRRIATQFDDLQQCYLQLRAKELQAQQAAAAAGMAGAGGGEGGGGDAQAPMEVSDEGGAVGPLIDEGLQEFSRLLSVITRCNKLRLVAEVPRPLPRHHGSSSIISSLEFDREGALFATAGVSKRISIYDFASVAPHYPAVSAPPLPGGAAAVRSGAAPAVELLSRSKLSCLSWNKYIQAHIASSDYEGVVCVWDVASASLLHEYEAHSKRIWSVDFCAADPTLLASGSDDCSVKFWSTKSASSVAQVDAAANVCAVRWRPGSSTELGVGSADHSVYLYDLRNTSAPVCSFQGHRKAVSYVRFCSAGELVSASTDSTLRLWPVPDWDAAALPGDGGGGTHAHATRVFEGHQNEKNFVGLAVDGDFLACGSETSELFVYYKSLSKPVAQQSFSAHGEDGADSQSDKGFISAVCWRPGAHTLLAANSQGTVKIFSLTGSSGHA